MGGHVAGRCVAGGSRLTLTAEIPAVRVIPDVPTFAVDAGFWYSLPERLVGRVAVGSVVRVPLGGRRVGGFVVEVGDHPAARLRPVAAVSGEATVFDDRLLAALIAVAEHYVAPLSVVLGRTAPPNVPPGPPVPPTERVPAAAVPESPLADLAADIVGGRGRREVAFLTGDTGGGFLGSLAARVVAADGGVLAVYATAAEAEAAAAEALPLVGGRVVVAHGDLDARRLTEAWARARHEGGLVVGTPRVAAWPLRHIALIVVVEEGRRAMKDRQSPTVAVRDLVRSRGTSENVSIVFAGPTPSLELVGTGPEVRRPRSRPWGFVEVADRRTDHMGGRLLTDQARRAVAAVTAENGTSFLFAHRRGYSAAARCIRCRTVRRCASCGSRPDPGETCRRCGSALGPCAECGGGRFEPLGAGVGRVVEEAARVVGRAAVAAHPADVPVTVGTERDLVDLPPRDLVVLVDFDGLALGTSFRSGEEALRIGARLATRARGRLLVQTSDPLQPVVVALQRGDPGTYWESELALRARYDYPPSGEIVVVEIRPGGFGAVTDGSDGTVGARDGELRAAAPAGVSVLGPAPGPDGWRWLVLGRSLEAFRPPLRRVVSRWRDAGLTVRVDVDPFDV